MYERSGGRWWFFPLLASGSLFFLIAVVSVQPTRKPITADSQWWGMAGCKQHADITQQTGPCICPPGTALVQHCTSTGTADWPMHMPSWASDHSFAKHFQPARQGMPEQGGQHYSQIQEDECAYKQFFHGKVAGSYLELGGFDGKHLSHSHWLHTHLAWHGLLIEGAPKSYAKLQTNRPNDITVHAAVCQERRTIHYAECEESLVSDIEEFMSDNFKMNWASQLEKAVKTEITCVPLVDILAYYSIKHIDFFSLDVEGGELMVLQSIDYNCVTFNVIVIEQDGTDPQKDADIRALLARVGYDLHSRVHINEWFVRRGFHPSAAP